MMPAASMFQDHFDLFLPNDLNMTDPAMRKQASEAINKFYFDGKTVTADDAEKLTKVSDTFDHGSDF